MEEQSRLVIKNLEEENEGLSTRYVDLLNDLEKLRKQEAQWRIEKSGIDAKIKVCERYRLLDAISEPASHRHYATCYSFK